MNKGGRSVLYFLAGCLVFTETIIAVITKGSSTIDGQWILLFSFLSLTVVVGALLFMFYLNPVFITAERNDLVPLSLIQEVSAKTSSPKILGQLIASLSPDILKSGGLDIEEEDTEIEQFETNEIDENDEEVEGESDKFRRAVLALNDWKSEN